MRAVNYRVIAFDPGGTTGWAAYSAMYLPGTEQKWFSEEWTMGHLGSHEHHQELEILLGMQRVQAYTVVCERFDDRPGGTFSVNLKAKEYIGVIEKYCAEDGVELIRQMPTTAKTFVKDVNLKRLGLYYGKKWKHAMDAERHLLWYLVNGAPQRKDILALGWPNA